MPKPGRGKTLTDKQAKFVTEYLVDLNATQAALRAGYSKKTAHRTGQENLQKPPIAEAIAAKQEKLQKKTEITIERVIQEYKRLAFVDPTKIWDKNGKIKSIHKMDEDTRRAIAGMEISTIGNTLETLKKIKLWDKTKALDSLAKHLGMFVERREITGNLGLQVEVVNYGDFKE